MKFSNFSKSGFESRHNLMYWDNAEYYGMGAGASGYVNGVRYKKPWAYPPLFKGGRRGDARINEEHLSRREQMEEEMFLGLRKKSGVSKQDSKKNSAHLLKIYMVKLKRFVSSRSFTSRRSTNTNDKKRSLFRRLQ